MEIHQLVKYADNSFVFDNAVCDYIVQHKCDHPTYIISLCGETDQFPLWNAIISSLYAKSLKLQYSLAVTDLKFSKTIKNNASKQFVLPGIWISDYILLDNPCERDASNKYSKVAIYTTFTARSRDESDSQSLNRLLYLFTSALSSHVIYSVVGNNPDLSKLRYYHESTHILEKMPLLDIISYNIDYTVIDNLKTYANRVTRYMSNKNNKVILKNFKNLFRLCMFPKTSVKEFNELYKQLTLNFIKELIQRIFYRPLNDLPYKVIFDFEEHLKLFKGFANSFLSLHTLESHEEPLSEEEEEEEEEEEKEEGEKEGELTGEERLSITNDRSSDNINNNNEDDDDVQSEPNTPSMYLSKKHSLPIEAETDLLHSKYLHSAQQQVEKEEKIENNPQQQEQQLSNVSLLETPESFSSQSFSTTPLPIQPPLQSVESSSTVALLDSARAINHHQHNGSDTFISPTNKEKSVVVSESEYSTPDQKIFNPIESDSNDNSFSIPDGNTVNESKSVKTSPIKAKLQPLHNKNFPAYSNQGVVVEPHDISIYIADDDDEESEPVHFNTMPIKLPKDLIAKARAMRAAAEKEEEEKDKEKEKEKNEGNMNENSIEENTVPVTPPPVIHHKKNNSLDDNMLLHNSNNNKENSKRKGRTITPPPPLDLKSKNTEVSPTPEADQGEKKEVEKADNPIIDILRARTKIPSDELYISLKQYVSELVYIKDFFEMEKDLPKWKKFSSILRQSTLLENRKRMSYSMQWINELTRIANNSYDLLLLQPNDNLFWINDIRWLHCSQMIHMTMLITPDTPFGTCSIAINRFNETLSSLIKRNFIDKNKISTIFARKSFKDEMVMIGTVPYVLPPVTHPNVKPIPDWKKKLPFNTNKSAYQYIETLWKSFNSYRCPIVNGYTFYEDITGVSHQLGSIILTEKDEMVMMELNGLTLSNTVTLSLPNLDINNVRELIENRFPLQQEKSKP